MLVYRLLFSLLLVFPSLVEARAENKDLLVFAAASMRDAMNAIGSRFEDDCSCDVVFSFAATSTLARQVANGAPADVFVSASAQWTEWLEQQAGLRSDGSSIFAGNRLVIAASRNYAMGGIGLLKSNRFSMADPQSVPAGIYGRQAMQSLGVWESVKSNAVFTENVRLALKMVSRGDLAAGLVYQSDLVASPDLVVAYAFETGSHDKIHYTATETRNGNNTAAEFVEFLKQPISQELLVGNGFLPLSGAVDE